MALFSARDTAVSVAVAVANRDAPRWTVKLLTLVVWACLAGSVAYWVLQWPQAGGTRSAGATTVAVSEDVLAAPTATSLARALGAAPLAPERAAAPALSSRLSLVGVVRAGTRDGAALIAVDGKPARPVRVGAEVEPGLYVLALEPRRASLGPDPHGAESLSLELPRPKTP